MSSPSTPAAETKIDPGLDLAATRPLAVLVQAGPGAQGTAANAVRVAGGHVGPSLPVINGFQATESAWPSSTPASRP